MAAEFGISNSIDSKMPVEESAGGFQSCIKFIVCAAFHIAEIQVARIWITAMICTRAEASVILYVLPRTNRYSRSAFQGSKHSPFFVLPFSVRCFITVYRRNLEFWSSCRGI